MKYTLKGDGDMSIKSAISALSTKAKVIIGTAAVEIVENSEEKAHGLSVLMSHYSDNFFGEFQKEMLDSVSVIKIIADKWSCKEH